MPFLEFHAPLLFPPLTDSKALLHWLLQAPKTLLWKCYHTALPDVLTASTWAALTQVPPSTRTFPRAAKRTRCFPACAQHAKGNESCSSQLYSTVEWLLNKKVTVARRVKKANCTKLLRMSAFHSHQLPAQADLKISALILWWKRKQSRELLCYLHKILDPWAQGITSAPWCSAWASVSQSLSTLALD